MDCTELDKMRRKAVISKATEATRWRAPLRFEMEPRPEADEIVSFAPFHRHWFGLPLHLFLRGLLYFYGLRLHDLTPVGIPHISVFIMLCETLRIEPHFELWRCIFAWRPAASLPGWGHPDPSPP